MWQTSARKTPYQYKTAPTTIYQTCENNRHLTSLFLHFFISIFLSPSPPPLPLSPHPSYQTRHPLSLVTLAPSQYLNSLRLFSSATPRARDARKWRQMIDNLEQNAVRIRRIRTRSVGLCPGCTDISRQTQHNQPDVGPMLKQRQRRCPSIGPT